jgi:hypothetical protein
LNHLIATSKALDFDCFLVSSAHLMRAPFIVAVSAATSWVARLQSRRRRWRHRHFTSKPATGVRMTPPDGKAPYLDEVSSATERSSSKGWRASPEARIAANIAKLPELIS